MIEIVGFAVFAILCLVAFRVADSRTIPARFFLWPYGIVALMMTNGFAQQYPLNSPQYSVMLIVGFVVFFGAYILSGMIAADLQKRCKPPQVEEIPNEHK